MQLSTGVKETIAICRRAPMHFEPCHHASLLIKDIACIIVELGKQAGMLPDET